MGIKKETIEANNGKLPRLQRYEIVDKINKIGGRNITRDRALVAFLFMTGCRVEEVCKYIIEKNPLKTRVKKIVQEDGSIKKIVVTEPILERKPVNSGIQKKQITVDVERDIMKVINVNTLKRRKNATKDIPVIISKEKVFFDIFLPYYNKLGDESYLFPLTRQRCYKILSQVGLWGHFMRHLRLTNLAVEYGLNAQELKHFVNWATSITADSYVHLNLNDLIDKMKR